MTEELNHQIRKVLKKIFYICRLDWSLYDEEEDRNFIRTELQKLLKKGADINTPYAHFKGCLPLCEASRTGDEMVVNLLINHGADVNNCDKFKCSPLYISSSHGHFNVVKSLLHHKADVDSKNFLGYSPLLSAVENNHSEVAKELIKSGANVNIERPNICGVGMDLLTFALLTKGNNSLAESLLDAGLIPYQFTRPISSLLLDLTPESQHFVHKLIKCGFTFECSDWVDRNQSNMDTGIQEMVQYLRLTKSNPASLENLCRIVLRTCLSLSRIKMHIRGKTEQLPIPPILQRFILLESL